MRFTVKEAFCAEGVTYSSCDPRVYHFYPQLEVGTDRELTKDEKRKVIDAVHLAAFNALVNIDNATEQMGKEIDQ